MHSMAVGHFKHARATAPASHRDRRQQRACDSSCVPVATLEPLNAQHPLPNRDLDTGQVVKPGGYSLTDSTYAELLHRLASQPNRPIPPGIKSDVEAYYADPNAPITTKKDHDKWEKVQADLKTLERCLQAPRQSLPHLWGG